MLYALIFWIIVGLIAGALAKAIMPGDDPGGIIVTIIIGIVGAVLGGWLLSLIGLGGGPAAGARIWSIISGVVAAVILLAIYRALVARRTQFLAAAQGFLASWGSLRRGTSAGSSTHLGE